MKSSDMKIGFRLGLAFGLVMLLLLCVGGFSLLKLTQLDHEIDSLVNDRYPKTVLLHDIKNQVNIVARAIRNIQIIGKGEEVEKEKQRIIVARKTITENLEKLSQVITDARDKEIFKSVTETREAYARNLQTVIGLIEAGDSENARTTMLGALRKTQNAYMGALDTLGDQQSKEVATVGELTKSTVIQARIVIAIILFASMTVAIILAFLIVRSITRPLEELMRINHSIAEGDLSVRCDITGRDEIAQLGDSSQQMVSNLLTIINSLAETANQVASASVQMQATAEQIATGADEVAAQTGTVATAGEEMAATSNDIAHNCSLAAESSRQTSESAARGSEVIQETINGMTRIADQVHHSAQTVAQLGARSEQIGTIIGTIEDIADQTNLLALNAAIEAARAGEQGRGFAVVADEVRALAERTTRATKEIADMIKSIQEETKSAVTAMEEGVSEVGKGAATSQKSAEALEIVLAQVGEVTQQISQIATAAEEQTATTTEISTNIHQITDVVHLTAKGAGDTAMAASQLAINAQALQELVRKFKLA